MSWIISRHNVIVPKGFSIVQKLTLRPLPAGERSLIGCRAKKPAFGALGGTRTPNLLIRSQMLYPLSYKRWET